MNNTNTTVINSEIIPIARKTGRPKGAKGGKDIGMSVDSRIRMLSRHIRILNKMIIDSKTDNDQRLKCMSQINDNVKLITAIKSDRKEKIIESAPKTTISFKDRQAIITELKKEITTPLTTSTTTTNITNPPTNIINTPLNIGSEVVNDIRVPVKEAVMPLETIKDTNMPSSIASTNNSNVIKIRVNEEEDADKTVRDIFSEGNDV